MTLNQLAIAAGADLKWLQNAAAILGRPIKRTQAEAKIWALVHTLGAALELPLKRALAIATKAVNLEAAGVQVVVDPEHSRVASIVLDMNRFESTFNANLSRALVLETPRRRGRPRSTTNDPVHDAERYGIDISLLTAALSRSVNERLTRLDGNAEFLRQLRSRR